jgi:hypothetical protein
MNNPGNPASGQMSQASSMETTEATACITRFHTTLANLNAVSEQQLRGLLDIAITTAKLAHSLSSSQESRASTRTTASMESNALAELADQLKSAAGRMKPSGLDLGAESDASEEGRNVALHKAASSTDTESFWKRLEMSLNLAIENSVANQQELNELGQAILARAVTLLFSVSVPEPSNNSGAS